MKMRHCSTAQPQTDFSNSAAERFWVLNLSDIEIMSGESCRQRTNVQGTCEIRRVQGCYSLSAPHCCQLHPAACHPRDIQYLRHSLMVARLSRENEDQLKYFQDG
mmetsp:Transcript_35657/g.57328  ORF Transcript_35657/g.57328 Transcript_35657/m.57328 type:complete len:105 (-) Transcript_35657:417-731(-)